MRGVLKGVLIGIIVVAAIVGGFYLYQQHFQSKENDIVIDKTATVVEEIRKISEFTSACYYEEMVLGYKKKKKDEMVLIANGKVRAGFDLSSIEPDDVIINGDSLFVVLEPAKIFDIIINPSGYDVFVEKGKWSHDQMTTIKDDARNKLAANANAYGILDKATEYGTEKLSAILKAFGYKEVVVSIKEPDTGFQFIELDDIE